MIVFSDSIQVGDASVGADMQFRVSGFERGSAMVSIYLRGADIGLHLTPRDLRAMAASLMTCADVVSPIAVLEDAA